MNTVRPLPKPIFGRDALVAELSDALARDRWITLKGPPGVGKSTLYRTLAAASREYQWVCVSARSAPSRAELVADIASALGIEQRFAEQTAAFRSIAEALDVAQTALVIDDADFAHATVSELVSDLAAVCEQLTILVCAWRPAGLAPERVIDVAPIDLESAVRLLRSRVERREKRVSLNDADARVIVGRASCLPLAIELAASRIASVGVDTVLQCAVENAGFATLDQSLDAAIASLDRAEFRAALSALAVFENDFDAAAAVAVIPAESRALASLERLVEASLIQSSHDDSGTRFCMLSVVRDFVARTAPDTAARERHAAYFAAVPRANTDDQSRWSRVAHARSDLLAAWNHSITDASLRANGPSTALALALVLEPLLVTQGPAELHRALITRTVDATDGANAIDPSLARSLVELELSLGKFDAIRGHFRSAIVSARAALVRAESARATMLVGWCCTILAYASRPLGALDEAEAFALRALAIAQEQLSHPLASQAEQIGATIALSRGDHPGAITGYQRALTSARLAASPRLEAIVFGNLASAYQRAQQYDRALDYCDQSRALFERRNDRLHLARLAVHREAILVEADRTSSDAALLAALDAVVAQGNLEGELEAREALALFAHSRGDNALFRQRLDELIACARFTDDVEWPERLAALSRRAQRESANASHDRALRLSRRGDRVIVHDESLDFSRRGPLKRVLLALVDAHARGAVLNAADVQSAGWPGERMRAESAAARVYMAIRRLRTLGLGALIRTSDAGYSLDPATDVRWID